MPLTGGIGRRMGAYVCVDRRKRTGGAKRRRGGRAPAKAAPEAGPGELRSKFNNLRSMVECEFRGSPFDP